MYFQRRPSIEGIAAQIEVIGAWRRSRTPLQRTAPDRAMAVSEVSAAL
jgi:hypothetical protein